MNLYPVTFLNSLIHAKLVVLKISYNFVNTQILSFFFLLIFFISFSYLEGRVSIAMLNTRGKDRYFLPPFHSRGKGFNMKSLNMILAVRFSLMSLSNDKNSIFGLLGVFELQCLILSNYSHYCHFPFMLSW